MIYMCVQFVKPVFCIVFLGLLINTFCLLFQEDRDVEFKINCSGDVLMNMTVISSKYGLIFIVLYIWVAY